MYLKGHLLNQAPVKSALDSTRPLGHCDCAESSALSPARSRLGCLQTSWSSMMGRLRPYHVDQGHCSRFCVGESEISLSSSIRLRTSSWLRCHYAWSHQCNSRGLLLSPLLSCISCNLAWQWKQQIPLLRHLCLQDWMTATAFYVTPQLKSYTGFSLSETTQQEQWLAQKGQTTLNLSWKDFTGCL